MMAPDFASDGIHTSGRMANGLVWRGVAWLGFLLVAVICCCWVLLQAYLLDKVTVRFCQTQDRVLGVDANPPPVFLSYGAYDGYVWNDYAVRLAEDGGGWRLHWTMFDNAPQGRPMHWSSGYAGYLLGLGKALAAETGEPLRHAVFRMSLWADPLLMVAGLLLFGLLAAWWFGPLAGAAAVVCMVTMPSFSGAFLPGNPDHHSVISLALLGLFLGLVRARYGWLDRDADLRTLRRAQAGMIFSGVCGAVGFWVSALSMCLALGAVGAGLLVASTWAGVTSKRNDVKANAFHPGLWRLWAGIGGAGALGFYLLEYFPARLGFRLEVNHPFYGLAWVGGGLALAGAGEWLAAAGWRNGRPLPVRTGLYAVACVLPLAAAFLFARDQVFLPSDPFLIRICRHTVELRPLLEAVGDGTMNWFAVAGAAPLILPAAIVLALRAGSDGLQVRAPLVALGISGVVLAGFQLYQLRWGLLTGSVYVVLAALLASQAAAAWSRLALLRKLGTLLAAVAALAALIVPAAKFQFSGLLNQYRDGGRARIDQGQALGLLHRQIAVEAFSGKSAAACTLLSSPNSSNMVASIAGTRTLGTAYWENIAGLKAAAAIFSSTDEGEIERLLHHHGITHILLLDWANFVQEYRESLELPKESETPSFGQRLLTGRDVPGFLTRIDIPQSVYAVGLGQNVRLYKVILPAGNPHAPRQ